MFCLGVSLGFISVSDFSKIVVLSLTWAEFWMFSGLFWLIHSGSNTTHAKIKVPSVENQDLSGVPYFKPGVDCYNNLTFIDYWHEFLPCCFIKCHFSQVFSKCKITCHEM